MNGRSARAIARANIALAKYWGKVDTELNLPAVPSISITLDPLRTETHVAFEPGLTEDQLELDDRPSSPRELARATALLDDVRGAAKLTDRARIRSRNAFPTASGLASSASGFAALAAAAVRAAGLDWDDRRISALARKASASAARSIYGGYVRLQAGVKGDGVLAAEPLFPPEYWDLRIVVAVAGTAAKSIGSTDGMEHSRLTSPYFRPWVELSEQLTRRIHKALETRELNDLGPAVEQSALCMHACALASNPGLLYWRPATIGALHKVRQLRDQEGLAVWATIDAGPHVKALCSPADAGLVAEQLQRVDGVESTLTCRPGTGVEVSR